MNIDKLTADLMNIPCKATLAENAPHKDVMTYLSYKDGHRDARHAAMEVVLEHVKELRISVLEDVLKICYEMEQHYSDYKDTALLNGDVDLSNAASGEPRACRFIAEQIRNMMKGQ